MFGLFRRKNKAGIADDPGEQEYLGVLGATEMCELMCRDLSAVMWSPHDEQYEPVTDKLLAEAQRVYDELRVEYSVPSKNTPTWDCDNFAGLFVQAVYLARQQIGGAQAKGLGVGCFNTTIFSGRHRTNWLYDGTMICQFEVTKWKKIDTRSWPARRRATVTNVTG